jgi:8-oxo-dGTP pyrophosphatase MutT (NUDIX family)
MAYSANTNDERLKRIDRSLPDWRPAEIETPPDGYREAAVSLVLRAGTELDLLLIKRAKSERDPWSGHMALPGGRRDDTDASLLDTAIRETLEETALDLSGAAHVLGRLETVAPVNQRLPKLFVLPIVFGVEAELDAVVNSHEVASVHWVPVRTLQDPATVSETTILLPTGPRAFPCYRVDGEIVWGMTYRILSRFFAHLC